MVRNNKNIQNKFDKNYYFGDVYSNYDKFLNWEKVGKDLIKCFEFNSFLDIGCGCGNLVLEIQKQKRNIDVLGIDVSEFAIKKANSPFVILADCKALPFENNRFDITHILGAFSYLANLEEIKQAITEAYRVSKKIILFEDVYNTPDKKSDDYDPYRQQFFSREQWMHFWKTVTQSDKIEIYKYAGQGRFYDIIKINKI
ncbi:MAG: methyltransferase domain-containing protein [Patescibacteria group bacterium]